MACFSCNGKADCVGIGIIASVIIGVIAAFLRITAVITVTPAFLWVVFGIAGGYLAVLLATGGLSGSISLENITMAHNDANVQDADYVIEEATITTITPLSALLAGILGTILVAVILLAISFVATSIIGAILTGLLLLFFSLIITATACLVKNVANC